VWFCFENHLFFDGVALRKDDFRIPSLSPRHTSACSVTFSFIGPNSGNTFSNCAFRLLSLSK
jgi:hypothetical protein